MSNKNVLALVMLGIGFFLLGFVTNLNDIGIPHLQELFKLNYARSMFIQLTFFGTYAVMSLPLSVLVNKSGLKYSLILGFGFIFIGCIAFIPAARSINFNLFLLAYFIVATGVTMLNLTGNSYASLVGPKKTVSSRYVMLHSCNSFAAFLSPLFGGFLVFSDFSKKGLSSLDIQLLSANQATKPYIIIAILVLVAMICFSFCRLQKIDVSEQDALANSSKSGSVWKKKRVILGAIAIYCYVGAEVSIGSFAIKYFSMKDVGNFSLVKASHYLSYYWLGAFIGRLLGIFVLRKIISNKAIIFYAFMAALLVFISSISTGYLSVISLVLVGFFNSILFPTIASIALRGLTEKQTNKGSGILNLCCCGGAGIPVLMGLVADSFTIRVAFVIPILCYLYIIFYGSFGYDKKVYLPSMLKDQMEPDAH